MTDTYTLFSREGVPINVDVPPYSPNPSIDAGLLRQTTTKHYESISTKKSIGYEINTKSTIKNSFIDGSEQYSTSQSIKFGPIGVNRSGEDDVGVSFSQSFRTPFTKWSASASTSGKIEGRAYITDGTVTGGFYVNVDDLENTPNVLGNLAKYGSFIGGLIKGTILAADRYIDSSLRSGNSPIHCFSGDTIVRTSSGDIPISEIRIGDLVWAFDPTTDCGRGELVLKRVTRLYRNSTKEWIKLSWVEGSEQKSLVSTPGHHFLDAGGHFRTLEQMANSGSTTVVLTSGELAEVIAERIAYSKLTAHLFERVMHQSMFNGNLALETAAGERWQTYNLEVEDLHTYVAGGVRVHNESGIFGALGQSLNRGLNASGLVSDLVGTAIDYSLHTVDIAVQGISDGFSNLGNSITSGVSGVFTSITAGVVGFFGNLAEGNIGGAIGSAFAGAVGAVASAVGGIVSTIGSVATGIANTIGSIFGGSSDDGDTDGSVSENSSAGESDSGGGFFSGVADAVGSVVGGIADAVGSVVGGIADAIGGFFGGGSSNNDNSNSNSSSGGDGGDGGKPIILDLDGDGIQVAGLDRSTVYMDADGDGLLQRTAWADAGDGVLFVDPDGHNAIVEKRQYVFTEWDPTATSDMEALASIFDSNGDGILSAADDDFADFKLLVTEDDGSTTVKTLTQLGITEIDLTADATHIELADGSVITGQSTFKRSDGTTGTVGDMLLMSEEQGHRIDQNESTDGSGNRVLEITAYAADGTKAYSIHSVTSPDGSDITNRYDDNGDGVVDRIQTIVTVTNPDGSTVETESNLLGSVAATAVLQSRTVTSVSADGLTETIERDATGGGWYDEREVRVTNADGSRTITTSYLAQNGSVINSISETVSIDGLQRVEAIDEDGDGTADTTTTHTVAVHVDDSRTETMAVTNADGSLRSHVTQDVSADGRTKSIKRDLDGDGDIDVQEDHLVVVAPNGTSTSTTTIKNGDGTTRSTVTTDQSADTLTKTSRIDADGDGDIDLTVVDATTINPDGSRETVVTQTNNDGSVRAKSKVTLGADKVTGETWEDLNQNGVFEASDLLSSVVVNATTQERTATDSARNADGSIRAEQISVTSADGLNRATTIDADGDGDTDTSITDVTTVDGAGVATRVIETRNQDGSLRDKTTIVTSADGLTVTTETDLDGDGLIEEKIVDTTVLEIDDSTTQIVSRFAGDGTTLLDKTVTQKSADRLTVTVSIDSEGDGTDDRVVTEVQGADGAVTRTETAYNADSSVVSRIVTNISANGLTTTEAADLDGDLVADLTETTSTALNADGSRTTTETATNADASLRMRTQTTITGDGLVTTSRADADGDGTFERESTDTTVLNADGSITTTGVIRSADATVLNGTQVTESDDGLQLVRKTDADGDGVYDLVETATTVLQDDGGTVTATELRDDANVLRNSKTETASDDERSIVTDLDVDGDGITDTLVSRTVADDGTIVTVTDEYASDGTLQSRARETVSGDGLVTTTEIDRDGNGSYEIAVGETSVLNADGSLTTTTETRGSNGKLHSRTVSTTSDDRLSETITDNIDGDGQVDLTVTQQTVIAANGSITTTQQKQAANGSVISSVTDSVSADGRTTSFHRDMDGDGQNDEETLTSVGNDGLITQVSSYFAANGSLDSQVISTESSDGLLRTRAIDYDGDGTNDLTMTETIVLGADGHRLSTAEHRDDQGGLVASEIHDISDDGLRGSIRLDLDGDGTEEFETDYATNFSNGGTITKSWATRDAGGTLMANTTHTTSGNGLLINQTSDFNGDGSVNHEVVTVNGASGGSTETVQYFGASGSLLMTATTVVSNDERERITTADLDGDGDIDREMVSQTDFDRNEITVYEDKATDGSTEARITATASANGTSEVYLFDVDGDGETDITRETTVSYQSNGDEKTIHKETFGRRELQYSSKTIASADGLSSTTTFDVDGDGVTDGTTQTDITLNPDGSRTTITAEELADGTLRSRATETVSADSRNITESRDFDGDGQTDKTSETIISADQSVVTTETGYDENGNVYKVFVTSVSADGLITTLLRDGVEQSITYSAVDNGSYVWDNGVTASATETHIAVSHAVDAQGIEIWRMESTVNGSTAVHEAVFNTSAKDRLLAEAAHIYDSVFDRAMDITEVETLVQFVSDGQLDLAGLSSALLNSGEYAARYGTLSDSQFITRTYLNTFGRASSLSELGADLGALDQGTKSRAELVAELSQSAEHLVVGNVRESTNNSDVFLNPVGFERSLNVLQVASTIKRLIDVVYDRDATAGELQQLSSRLLTGTEQLEDVAADLLASQDPVSGVSVSLFGLEGADFVNQAFVNALARSPTLVEEQTWFVNIASGRISKEEFVAALAQSVEFIAQEVDNPLHLVGTSSGETLRGGDAADLIQGQGGGDRGYGMDGNDTVEGGDGVDWLDGGLGNDSIHGGSGSDFMNGGRGDDILEGGAGSDYITGGPGFDRASYISSGAGVSVNLDSRSASGGDAAGDDLSSIEGLIGSNYSDTFVGDSSDNTFEGRGGADNLDGGNGYDTASYESSGSGVSVNLQTGAASGGDAAGDTLTNIEGLAGSGHSDTLVGDNADNSIDGRSGPDSLSGGGGNDTIDGGSDNDQYWGGSGADRFVFRMDHGDDVVEDFEVGADTVEFDYIDQSSLVFSNDGADTTITHNLGTVVVKGVTWSSLPSDGSVVFTNHAPISVQLGSASVEENMTGAAIGVLSTDDPDQQDVHTYSVDDSRFEVTNGQLKLIAGESLDYETEDSVRVRITATDGGGLSITKSFTIEVQPVNEHAPTSIALDNLTVGNLNTGALVGKLMVTDPDSADQHSFESSDDRFEVLNGQLKLKDGVSVDHATEQSISTTVTATDSGGLFFSQAFTITVLSTFGAHSFVRGEGHKVINETSGAGVLQFGIGITLGDLAPQRDGNDLLIYVRDPNDPSVPLASVSDTVRITGWWTSSNHRIASVEFDDGSSIDVSTIESTVASSDGDWRFGDDRNDNTTGGEGNDVISGWAGNDQLHGDEDNRLENSTVGGDDVLDGGAGRDTLFGDARDRLTDTSEGGSDILIGGIGDDKLYGDGNQMHDFALGGNDILDGDEGDDELYGDGKELTANAIGGNDILNGGVGNDKLYGDGENFDNNVQGGNDTLNGGLGNDLLYGDGRELKNSASGGNDVLNGGLGNDELFGDGQFVEDDATAGNDVLNGGDGADYLYGDSFEFKNNAIGGDDVLNGGAGNDELYGDAEKTSSGSQGGDDVLDGGSGDDILTGGSGDDTFVFAAGFGYDTITDFTAGAATEDVIEFDAIAEFSSYADVLEHAVDDGTDTTITLDIDNSIVLTNVLVSELSVDDFRFT